MPAVPTAATAAGCTASIAATGMLTGTIAIGTPLVDAPERDRPDPRRLVTDWLPA